ncbi:MAG: hypothetical protein LHW45_09730 [Candidatus Cloacimonetes bacterium]|nr:hypothetical protein [Candidatus Cloacimonadota bacterium]MDY0367888.1 hypothetical protein [Candidatus Syntrophosphaera sp.]
MRPCEIVLAMVVLLTGTVFQVWAVQGPLGNDVLIENSRPSPAELMQAMFGNFHPRISCSALDPKLTPDPDLLKWKVSEQFGDPQADWDDLDEATWNEFKALGGHIPIRFLKSYDLPYDRLLLAFEAGGWTFLPTRWGGEIFTGSHNLGMAAFTRTNQGWLLSGYDLDLGRFGAYCTTTLSDTISMFGEGEFGVITYDYSCGLFTVADGVPKLLLKIPHFHGYGHCDPEEFTSEITFEPSSNSYHDVVVKTAILGKNSFFIAAGDGTRIH